VQCCISIAVCQQVTGAYSNELDGIIITKSDIQIIEEHVDVPIANKAWTLQLFNVSFERTLAGRRLAAAIDWWVLSLSSLPLESSKHGPRNS
jgi:hypothetical protein